MIRNAITIIATGGRNYNDETTALIIATATQKWRDQKHPGRPLVLKHGMATGADTLMDKAVIMRWDFTMPYRADWAKLGRAAGPIRNQQMITSGADAVFAFPGGRGTANCVSLAKSAGLPVLHVADGIHPVEVWEFLDSVLGPGDVRCPHCGGKGVLPREERA